MQEFDISTASVVAHILITWIPWLIGIAMGGGLGALCALGIHATLSARPAWRRSLVLLPWRTLVMGLLMVVWSPFVASLLWLGPVTGGLMVAGSVSLLAMASAAGILVEHWHPSPVSSCFVAGAWTLGVASALLAAAVGLLGGGGLGPTILEAARLLQYGLMWKGLLVILALALALDLGLGVTQMIALQRCVDNRGLPLPQV